MLLGTTPLLFCLLLALVLASYLLGALPIALWVARRHGIEDIRDHGSKNAGATNVARVCGKQAGLTVLVLDVLKGALPVALAKFVLPVWAMQNPELLGTWTPETLKALMPPLLAVIVVLGHAKSVFMNFQGGKSSATGMGTLLAMTPLWGAGIALVIYGVFRVTRMVSVASLVGCMVAPLVFYFTHQPLPYLIYISFITLYVVLRHRANIQRLLQGTENRL
ncbi:MAG: glycerol-3-phosphate 1-O-acyltransferase PlsY [Vampirovibrionales bacterium]